MNFESIDSCWIGAGIGTAILAICAGICYLAELYCCRRKTNKDLSKQPLASIDQQEYTQN